MALIKCPECNKEISEYAKTCPSCGFKLKNPKRKKRNRILVGSILLAVAICAGSVVTCGIHERNQKLKELDHFVKEFSEYPQRPRSYTEFAYLIDSQSWIINNDARVHMRAVSTRDNMNNVPFEQSQIYTEWDTYYKLQFKRK